VVAFDRMSLAAVLRVVHTRIREWLRARRVRMCDGVDARGECVVCAWRVRGVCVIAGA
jgi:hypothetical protein